MEYFVISAKFVPLKYYTLSSQLQRLISFSVGCSGRRILSPGQIAVMRKWSIDGSQTPIRLHHIHFNKYIHNMKQSIILLRHLFISFIFFSDCNMTVATALLTKFVFQLWFFGACYYWANWVFLGVSIGEGGREPPDSERFAKKWEKGSFTLPSWQTTYRHCR